MRYRNKSSTRSSFYRIAQILALIAGIIGIIILIFSFIGNPWFDGWFWDGGFGVDFNGRLVVSIICSILVLLVGLGSIFLDIRGIILGIIVIILSLFMPGIAELLGIISGILYILGDIL
ncbi:MAG: hypothetical protein ACFFDW_02195 [Candidatus Thorarchaeota archaeon]